MQAVILLLVASRSGCGSRLAECCVALAIIAVMAVSLSALSYTLGLAVKSEAALGPMLNGVTLPLLLLSGVLLPMSFAPPGWT